MAGARISYTPEASSMEVQGHGLIRLDTDSLAVASVEVAGNAYLYSLTQAMRRHVRFYGEDVVGRFRVQFSDVPEQYFDPDFVFVEPTSLVFERDSLFVEVVSPVDAHLRQSVVARLLGPLLAGAKARLQRFATEVVNDVAYARTTVEWPTSRRTVNDALAFGSEIDALVTAAGGPSGELTQQTALDLLRARRWDLFKGQPESDWLDVKQQPYDWSKPNAKYELAKDVAAFANSPSGGLIVLGMTARDKGDGEVVTGYKEFDLRTARRATIRRHVAQLIYPQVTGFEVERLEGTSHGRGLAVLVVPAQPVAQRPFMVSGVVSQGEVLGAFIQVPVRHADETARWDIGAIHTRLQLGERVLNRTLDA